MSRRFTWRAAVTTVATVACTILAWALVEQGTGRGQEPTATDGNATTQQKKFALVYNVNNAGYIDVCGCKHKEVRQGSITRRAAFLKQLRATGRSVLLLDGGSAFFPINKTVKPTEMPEAIRKAELIVAAYNRMGYMAMAVGPYDLIGGLDALKKLAAKAEFKMLSANFTDADGKLHFAAHTIFTVNGVRVGVFGLTLDTIPGPRLDKWAPGSKILDPATSAKKAYAELRPKVDLVIALAQLREDANFELVKTLKNLEILIDPYIQLGTHKTWLKDDDPWVQQKESTLFLRSDGQGARLGLVDIELTKSGKPLFSGDRYDELAELIEFDEASAEEKKEAAALKKENLFRFTRLSLEPHQGTDPEIDALVDAFKRNIKFSTAKAATTALPNKDQYLKHGACKSCHEKQYKWWKTTSHSHAMETLRKTNDHQRYDCIGCHSLGYGQAWLDTTNVGDFGDVQCESCHGTKPEHIKDPKKSRFGRTTRNSCIACHNKEQTRIEFPYLRSKRKVACPKG
jgi:2',3'-cyclic-nucleotide 2'-phosphodiesterase (5'-nucleotidase family)